MRLILIFLGFIFTNCLLSQYIPIWTIPSDYSQFELKAFEMNDSGSGLILTVPYDGGPISDMRVYTTLDYGQSWDSTFFPNRYMMTYNGGVTESGNLYFSSLEVYTPIGAPSVQIKVFHGSTDGGQTWFTNVIDTIVGANKENSIKFMNDSVGTFFYQNGIYVTTDFGQTWERKTEDYPTNGVPLNDSFMYFGYNTGITYNLTSNVRDSFFYESFAVGQVYHSVFEDDKIYRGIRAQDGTAQGSSYNFNYASLNIDELPLGDQKVIHFPQNYALVDIEVTNSCIHLALDGRYVRSCDGGNTFDRVDPFNGSNSDEIHFMSIVNDTLGFIIAKNLMNNEWRLWKTTNGGGSNWLSVLTNVFTANVDELDKNISFEMFPNPSEDNLNIESEVLISEIDIYSVDGKLVLIKKLNSKKYTIDISSLSKGNYIVKVYSEGSVGVSKLVKN